MASGGQFVSDLPTRPVPYPRFDGSQPCREIDPELFFPRNSKETWYHRKETEQLCARCPFLQECRDYAISYGVTGYWGGLTFKERQKERARLGIAAIPVRVGDRALVRNLIAEYDDGETSSEDIARLAGCSSKTVQRIWVKKRGVA